MKDLIIYAGAYLLGSIPTAKLAGKGKPGKGWKKHFTLKAGLDVLKGAAAVTLGHLISPGDAPDWVFAGFLCLLADEFPVFNRFQGGRSLGTLVGVFGALLYWMLSRGI
jgi:glycerol-3-phosphate acyltransferase PlsY